MGHSSDTFNRSHETSGFPMPDEKLIILDIDGTLINREYEITDDRIYPVLNHAQVLGWEIGLSSDTPYEVMCSWRQDLGITGPIIAEKGAVVEIGEKIEYDEALYGELVKSYKNIIENFAIEGVEVWEGNPVKGVKQKYDYLPGTRLALFNCYRLTSFSFMSRLVKPDGTLAIDNELTETLAGIAREYFPDTYDLMEDVNHEYGVLIISPREITKELGSRKLRTSRNLGRFAMIGNSYDDFLGHELAVHYAVSNSSEGFKSVADYVANEPITRGVVEILEKMVVQNKHYETKF